MKKTKLLILFFIGFAKVLFAQIPFEIINNTTYADSEVYACIIGLNASNERVYVNLKTAEQITTSAATNTIAKSSSSTELYGDIFTKLSDIPVDATTGRKTVSLSEISSVRVYFSIASQLYIKFYDDGGYTGPIYGGTTDVNYGITFEFIELTYSGDVIYINTSRVDSFNYPIGIELFAENDVYQKSGELKTFEETGEEFLSSVPTEFQGCYDSTNGRIQFPTSTDAFKTGGDYENYSQTYIDAIWTKFKTEDLLFNGGGIGIWKGRVDDNDQLVLVGQADLDGSSGPYEGETGTISSRPSTTEAWNGSGVLNEDNGNSTVDKFLQAQICAAITRHAIDVDTEDVGYQDFQDSSRFYVTEPYNYYAKFWHQTGISYDNKSYGFPYDDVADQSSTLAASSPTKTTVYFGGFADISTDTTLPSPWSTSDIGEVGTTGSASYASSTFSVSGSGSDIWNTADEFRYVYQTLSGDGEIVAEVNSLTNTNGWAKAGVMFRETLDSGSINAAMLVTPSKGVSFQKRTTTSGTSSYTGVSGQTAPKWLKMKRVGNVFSAYYSADGTTWTQAGSSTTISMASSVYVGLCVTSHVDATLCTASIDNVSVSSTSSTVAVTGISLSPTTASLTTGGTQQLTATITPTTATTQTVTWSSSNTAVATVSSAGLITAIAEGSATITATTTSESKTATCTVTVSTSSCTATASTGDYTVTASTSSSNPTLTFIPSRTDVGATTCILYYSTSATGSFPGYKVTPNTAYTITASSGQTVYFYYTYSLPEGGENNTSANKHSFTVGNCSSLATAKVSSESDTIVSEGYSIYPNPSSSEIYIQNADSKTAYSVFMLNGSSVLSGTGNKVDISTLASGLYIIKVNETVLRFIKQ